MKYFLISIVCIILFSVSIMAQDLVLYYPFDGDKDKATDKSGNGYDGKFDAGKINLVASKEPNFGQAMSFDGTQRIAAEGKNLTISGPITFAFWTKKGDEIGGSGTLPRVISRTGDLHELAMDSGHLKKGTFAIYLGGAPAWTTCMPLDMEWHHIAVTSDGSTVHAYLDGDDVFQLKAAGPASYTGTFYVGSRCDLTSKEFYNGLVDELALYSGAITKEKVKEIMNGGVKGQLLAVSPKGKLAYTWGYLKSDH
jgi:hypothetical protein